MNQKEVVVAVMALLGGVFCILSSVLNWDFFFASRKAQRMVSFLGHQGARIFYIVLGVVMIGLSIGIMM